jgi:hypothetical protein
VINRVAAVAVFNLIKAKLYQHDVLTALANLLRPKLSQVLGANRLIGSDTLSTSTLNHIPHPLQQELEFTFPA